MSRLWAGVTALLLVLSACSGPPPPLERITAACALLSSPKAGFYLGRDLVPVEYNYGGLEETFYSCDFNRGNETLLRLSVREFSARDLKPQDFIGDVARRSRVQTTNVTGVGDAAVSYERGKGTVVLAAAKKAGPNVRLVSLDAVGPFSADRLAVLGSMVMARL
jgi:hypothetical protein